LKVPSTVSASVKPTNRFNLKYVPIPALVKISTSETDAFVVGSTEFVIVCPTRLFGSPEILSATTTSLLLNCASDGLKRYLSRSTTVGVSP